jgi:epoxide hydrolase-like predicted phosphatase
LRDDIRVAIRAVIFDIGGVLELNPRTGWEQRWATRLGLDVTRLLDRIQPIWRQGDIGALDLTEVEHQTAAELMLDEPTLRALMDDLWAEYLGTLNEPLADYFAGLRPRYRTGILSNSFVGAREREQAAYGFEDMCDVVVYSHEEGLKKPDRRFYEIACARLRVQPAEAIFLDDVPACVDGAGRAGMTAIRFRNNDQAIGELEAVTRRGRRLPPRSVARLRRDLGSRPPEESRGAC